MFGIFKKKEKEAPTTPLNVGAMAATVGAAFEGLGAGRTVTEGSEAVPVAEANADAISVTPVTTTEAAPAVDFQAMIQEAVVAQVVPLQEKIVALEDSIAAKQTMIGLLKEQNEKLQMQSHLAPQPDVTAPAEHTFQEETQAS